MFYASGIPEVNVDNFVRWKNWEPEVKGILRSEYQFFKVFDSDCREICCTSTCLGNVITMD